MNFWLKLLQGLNLLEEKKRNEIREGKLWEITSVWGRDLEMVEMEVAQPDPFVKPEAGQVDAMRVHIIRGEDNVTNLTKNPELL